MKTIRRTHVWLLFFLFAPAAFSQILNRVAYNNQNLFLSGSNLAWVNYGQDIGLGTTDTASIAGWMLQMHQHGGNAMRMWLSVEGMYGYTFDANGRAAGLAPNTISDLKRVLRLAWEREIGINFCLWGFGMLSSSLDPNVLARNDSILTDTSYTNAYIRNCLIPMVNALKGDPALICWEIFNEPEGMSTLSGWSGYQHVSMAYIQKFVNLLAGAIHRADPDAKVTNGAVSLATLTDVQSLAKESEHGIDLATMSSDQKTNLENIFNKKYRRNLPPQTADEIVPQLKKLATSNYNYYRDDRLKAAGGDSLGILDFYSFHYYDFNYVPHLSPFTHLASKWNLTKPLVVAEFGMQSSLGGGLFIDNVPTAALFDTLYSKGYAGALPWSWSDPTNSTEAEMLAGMQSIWNEYPTAVEINGTGADWPYVSITNPQDGAIFSDTTQVTIQISVTDSSTITSVDIFVSDTLNIAHMTASPYTFIWKNITPGIYRITAAATNSLGHKQISNPIQIIVGTPPMTRYEAENAVLKGSGLTVKTDNTASNHKFVDITNATSTSVITWTLNNVFSAGNYKITFGYRLSYGTPKYQWILVNGDTVRDLQFAGTSTTAWYGKDTVVYLKQDTNTIQMSMEWGWMQLDYLDVGSVPTSVENFAGNIPEIYSLKQNYPNPFNPTTTIRYSLPKSEQVKLTVFDVLGRQVATLVDKKQSPGVFEVSFNGTSLSSGVYFYKLNIGTFTETKKMMLLK